MINSVCGLVAFVLSGFALSADAPFVPFRVVAVSGAQAPGISSGVVFKSLQPLPISDDGDVLVYAGLSGPNVSPGNDLAVFTESFGSGLSLVVRYGSPIDGFEPELVAGDSFCMMSRGGLVACYSRLDGDEPAFVLFKAGSDGNEPVARNGELAPDGFPYTAPIIPVGRFYLQASASGRMSFSERRKIFAEFDGLGTLRINQGRPPRFPAGSFARFTFTTLFSRSGRVAFADMVDDGSDPLVLSGLFSVSDGVVSTIARTGDRALGLPSDVVLSSFSPSVLEFTYDDVIMISATVSGSGVDHSNDEVVLAVAPDGTAEVLAREGGAAPFAGQGAVYDSFIEYRPGYMGGVMHAQFTIPGDEPDEFRGLVALGGPSLVARTGQQAPGFPDGSLFTYFFNEPFVSLGGQVVLGATLSTGERVIYSFDPVRGLRLIAVTGRAFDLDQSPTTDDLRTIFSFRNLSINDSGHAAVSLSFEDQSSAVVVFDTLGSCTPADLVEPFGITDLDDIDAFLDSFLIAGPEADFAPPFGVLDFDDIDAFLAGFLAGCP